MQVYTRDDLKLVTCSGYYAYDSIGLWPCQIIQINKQDQARHRPNRYPYRPCMYVQISQMYSTISNVIYSVNLIFVWFMPKLIFMVCFIALPFGSGPQFFFILGCSICGFLCSSLRFYSFFACVCYYLPTLLYYSISPIYYSMLCFPFNIFSIIRINRIIECGLVYVCVWMDTITINLPSYIYK